MTRFIEKPANKQSIDNRKLVCGVGINDADYIVQPKINGKRVTCPYYSSWHSMLARCYSSNYQLMCPTYAGCSVCKEWLLFSNFKSWMTKQSWNGMALDKDILHQGNKVYSPDSCLFISGDINKLLSDRKAKRGRYLIGVDYHKQSKKFRASCSVKGSVRYIGLYETEEMAHDAYKEFKYKIISDIAKEQTEPLRSALLKYEINN